MRVHGNAARPARDKQRNKQRVGPRSFERGPTLQSFNRCVKPSLLGDDADAQVRGHLGVQADGHRVVAGSLDGRGDDDATTVDGLAQLLLDRVGDRSSGDSAEEAAGVADLRGDLNDTGLQRVAHDAGVVDRGDLVTAAGSGDLVDLLLGTSGPLGGEATGGPGSCGRSQP